MTSKNHLIEQHFLEHEARQKHVNELLAKAKDVAADAKISGRPPDRVPVGPGFGRESASGGASATAGSSWLINHFSR